VDSLTRCGGFLHCESGGERIGIGQPVTWVAADCSSRTQASNSQASTTLESGIEMVALII
jgi:hypothetical protein